MEAVVYDSFDMSGRVAIEYGATGVVICFSSETAAEEPEQGQHVLVIRPDGWMTRAKFGEVKKSGNAFSVFLPNLTKLEVPIESRVRWGSEFWPTDRKGYVQSMR